MITRNQIIHYTSDELIRVSIALTTGIVEKARQRHNLSPVASAALGRTMTGAALLAGDYKNHEGVSLKVAGDGPLGAVHADCFDTNKLRGYVDNPQVDLPLKVNGKLDVAAGVGQHGQLTVTRFTLEKTTYTSQADLVSGEIAEDIAYYLFTSEQVPSTISLGVLVSQDYTIAAAGGFLVQALPGAKDEDLARVEANITQVGALTTYLQGTIPTAKASSTSSSAACISKNSIGRICTGAARARASALKMPCCPCARKIRKSSCRPRRWK